MAVTNTPSTLEIQKWRRSFFSEWQRENLFAPYIGTGTDAVIQRIYELRDEGEQITIPIVGRLTGSGQVGANTLVGNEESMDQYGHKVVIDWARHAIVLNKKEMRKSAIDQLEAVRPLLTDWAAAKLRDDFVRAFGTVQPFNTQASLIGNVQGIPMATAGAAIMNQWQAGNIDRVLYGNSTANYNATHATALANVDTTNDKFTAANLALLKRVAMNANPKIRPYKTRDGYEYYVAFAGSNSFRDLKNDATIIANNKDARSREGNGMDKNPLFQDGDLIHDGVIIRQVPEISAFVTNVWTSLTTAGGDSGRVEPWFLCGQQAAVLAWGQMAKPTFRKEDDYGFIKGVGTEMAYGAAKMFKKHPYDGTNLKQWGVVSGFVAAPLDA